MRPCELRRTATEAIETARLSDGRHRLRACAIDFAGNRHCTDPAPAAHRQHSSGGAARPRPSGRRWLAPQQRLRRHLGEPRPGPGLADRRRLLPAHRAGGFDSGERHRTAAGDRVALGLDRPRAGRLLARRLASRRGRQRVARRTPPGVACSSTTSPQRWPSAAIATAPTRRSSRRPSPTPIPARRDGRDRLPAGRGAGAGRSSRPPCAAPPGAPGEAELIARFPSDRVRPGALPAARRGRRSAPATALPRTRRSDGERDGPPRAAEDGGLRLRARPSPRSPRRSGG